MKKSEAYRKAQYSVLRDPHLYNSDKLELIRILQDEEDLQAMIEKRREAEQEDAE